MSEQPMPGSYRLSTERCSIYDDIDSPDHKLCHFEPDQTILILASPVKRNGQNLSRYLYLVDGRLYWDDATPWNHCKPWL